MNISAKIGVACIVSLFFLTGCLTHMEAIVKGNPLRPTFEFEKEIILGVFTIDVSDPTENKSDVKDVWGISRDPNAPYYYTQQLEYGVVPPGLTEYIPIKTRDLIPNRLYSFAFSNGNARGSEVFAIVEIEGELKIVQFDENYNYEEIVAEYLEIVKMGSE